MSNCSSILVLHSYDTLILNSKLSCRLASYASHVTTEL